jgi:hypothetical protein
MLVDPELKRVRSLKSLVDGNNWFLNPFAEIPRRSFVICFLSLSEKAGLNHLRSAIRNHRLSVQLSVDVLYKLNIRREMFQFFLASKCKIKSV